LSKEWALRTKQSIAPKQPRLARLPKQADKLSKDQFDFELVPALKAITTPTHVASEGENLSELRMVRPDVSAMAGAQI
jgi:hypothetical protein